MLLAFWGGGVIFFYFCSRHQQKTQTNFRNHHDSETANTRQRCDFCRCFQEHQWPQRTVNRKAFHSNTRQPRMNENQKKSCPPNQNKNHTHSKSTADSQSHTGTHRTSVWEHAGANSLARRQSQREIKTERHREREHKGERNQELEDARGKEAKNESGVKRFATNTPHASVVVGMRLIRQQQQQSHHAHAHADPGHDPQGLPLLRVETSEKPCVVWVAILAQLAETLPAQVRVVVGLIDTGSALSCVSVAVAVAVVVAVVVAVADPGVVHVPHEIRQDTAQGQVHEQAHVEGDQVVHGLHLVAHSHGDHSADDRREAHPQVQGQGLEPAEARVQQDAEIAHFLGQLVQQDGQSHRDPQAGALDESRADQGPVDEVVDAVPDQVADGQVQALVPTLRGVPVAGEFRVGRRDGVDVPRGGGRDRALAGGRRGDGRGNWDGEWGVRRRGGGGEKVGESSIQRVSRRLKQGKKNKNESNCSWSE